MSRGCCDERKLGWPEDERALDGTAVIALNGFVGAGPLPEALKKV